MQVMEARIINIAQLSAAKVFALSRRTWPLRRWFHY
jgi:hypothetical protein